YSFFFQAEDGIRDRNVTGVQTCALPISDYSSDEIEYARVWLEVIDNKDIDHLHVTHQPEGEQVNPYDDDSVDYPEDVIFLSGDEIGRASCREREKIVMEGGER